MFLHDYPFDPCHGHDLDALLAVAAPEEPGDFVPFCAIFTPGPVG